MRLTSDQRERIARIIREHVGDGANVWLYGSRTADDRRGGDIDLLVRSPAVVGIREQAILHHRLEQELSLPIDISFIDPRQGMKAGPAAGNRWHGEPARRAKARVSPTELTSLVRRIGPSHRLSTSPSGSPCVAR